MGELTDTDRDVLVLRYLENLDLRRVGERVGIGEDAAQKRVSRALNRLREVIGRFGVSTTTAGLAVSLGQQVGASPLSVQAVALTATAGATGLGSVAAGLSGIAGGVVMKWAAGLMLAGGVAFGVSQLAVESAGEVRIASTLVTNHFRPVVPVIRKAVQTADRGNLENRAELPATSKQPEVATGVQPVGERSGASQIMVVCKVLAAGPETGRIAFPFGLGEAGQRAVLVEPMLQKLLETVSATKGLVLLATPRSISLNGQMVQMQVGETRTVALGTAASGVDGSPEVITTNMNFGTTIEWMAELDSTTGAIKVQAVAEVTSFAGYVNEELELVATPVPLRSDGSTLPVTDRAEVSADASLLPGQTLLVSAKSELLEKRHWFLFTPSVNAAD